MTLPFERVTFIAALGAATRAPVRTLALHSVHAQPAARLTPKKLTPNFRKTSQTSPFFLAQTGDHYKGESLYVPIDVGTASLASITRVASGGYRRGLSDSSSLIEFNAQNPGPTAVTAVYSHCRRASFVSTGQERRGFTKSFCSLEGKKITATAVASTRVDGPWWRENSGPGPSCRPGLPEFQRVQQLDGARRPGRLDLHS